jgi:ATP-dependent Zn protease
VALHEACHAVAAFRLKKRWSIDVATIEPRGSIGGFVSRVPMEEPGFPWRNIQEDDVVVALASLAGERHFYDGDNSMGVGGDLRGSTAVVTSMIANAGMGKHIASLPTTIGFDGQPAGGGAGGRRFHEIDEYLKTLLNRASTLVADNERWVMAISHALEQHHTITGEDIEAIFNGGVGPIVDGRWYHTDEFVTSYRTYHAAALRAHQDQSNLDVALPVPSFAASSTVTGLLPPPPPPPPPRPTVG